MHTWWIGYKLFADFKLMLDMFAITIGTLQDSLHHKNHVKGQQLSAVAFNLQVVGSGKFSMSGAHMYTSPSLLGHLSIIVFVCGSPLLGLVCDATL